MYCLNPRRPLNFISPSSIAFSLLGLYSAENVSVSLSISGQIWCSLSCPLWPRGTAVVASLKCRYSFIFRYRLRVMVSLTFLTWRYLFLDQKCRSEGKVLIPWSIRIPKYARMSVPFTGVQFWSCLPAALCFCSAFRFVSFTINSIKSSGNSKLIEKSICRCFWGKNTCWPRVFFKIVHMNISQIATPCVVVRQFIVRFLTAFFVTALTEWYITIPGVSISFCTSGYLRVTGGYICRRPFGLILKF